MTLIDKAEAHDDDLIRRGDALKVVSVYGTVLSHTDDIRALPAVVPGVKALEWEPSVIGKPWHSAKSPWGFYYAQWDDETQAWFASLEMGEVEAPIILSPSDVPSLEAAKAAAQADYEARILSALAPTDAAHVNETPKSEHDGADVLTAAQAREAHLREAASLVDDLGQKTIATIILALIAKEAAR